MNRLVKFFLVCLILMAFLTTIYTAIPADAYSADFEDAASGADASDLNIPGMTLSGYWAVGTQEPFQNMAGNKLVGCFGPNVTPAPLTINFVSPQTFMGFDFGTMGRQTLVVEAWSDGALVASNSFEGAQNLPEYIFHEGYASVSAAGGFDTVILHIEWCTAIDNLQSADGLTVAYDKIGQVRVTAPGVALHESADGSVVRDGNGSEMWVPNPNANNPHEDIYDVIDQTEIAGTTWVQIFVGSGDSYVWVPLGGSVTVAAWE